MAPQIPWQVGLFFGAWERHGTWRDPNTVTTCNSNVTTHCPNHAARILFQIFQGQVGAAGINWHGKRVVIAGMGAFAVENVHGAQDSYQIPDDTRQF